MGRMKDFLMKVSEDMGYEGDINDEVIEEAQDRIAAKLDFMHDQLRDDGIHQDVVFLKNKGTNEDSSSE